MRFSLLSVGALALMTCLAIAADPTEKKEVPEAAQTSEAAQSKEKEGDDQAQPSDEKPSTDENPDKAEPSPKKGSGIKLLSDDDANLMKTLSYMQGYGVGKSVFDQFRGQGIELDEEVLLAAFKDGLAGREPKMTEGDMRKMLPRLEKFLKDTYAAKAKERGMKTSAEGEAFLAANKGKEGVKTLASGLQYKVLKSGNGATPKKSDTVKVHYKGTLLNGSEFANSYKRATPESVQVNGATVIKGWAEALQLMKVGDKWQLFVPSSLAYDTTGAQDQHGHEMIPPYSTLVYEIELLGIGSPRNTAPPPALK